MTAIICITRKSLPSTSKDPQNLHQWQPPLISCSIPQDHMQLGEVGGSNGWTSRQEDPRFSLPFLLLQSVNHFGTITRDLSSLWHVVHFVVLIEAKL